MSSKNLQGFIESTPGQVILVAIIVVFFILILISGKNKKADTSALVTSAVLVALAVVLNSITLFRMPQGGSITPFSMVPIVLTGYFFGVRRGIMAGMCVGLIGLILNPYVIHPLQMLLDYPIAFGALALGAIFRNNKTLSLVKAYLFGVFCRYICAVLSGIIFFGDYVGEGFNTVTWSLWYNLTYLGIEAAISTAILCIPLISNTFQRLRLQVSHE